MKTWSEDPIQIINAISTKFELDWEENATEYLILSEFVKTHCNQLEFTIHVLEVAQKHQQDLWDSE